PPPQSTLFPYTTLFRSCCGIRDLRLLSPFSGRPCHHRIGDEGAVRLAVDLLVGARLLPREGSGNTCRAGPRRPRGAAPRQRLVGDRKSTRLNSSHVAIS